MNKKCCKSKKGEGNWLTDVVRKSWIPWWISHWHGWKQNGTKLKGAKGSQSSQEQRGEAHSTEKSHHTNLARKRASHLQGFLRNHSLNRLLIQWLHFTFLTTILSFFIQKASSPATLFLTYYHNTNSWHWYTVTFFNLWALQPLQGKRKLKEKQTIICTCLLKHFCGTTLVNLATAKLMQSFHQDLTKLPS